jgi:putative transposase
MNAMGENTALLTPHPIYQSLGNTPEERRQVYRALFANETPELALEEIRNPVNKAWVLGNDKFRNNIESQLGFALPPFPRGGDRRSTNLPDEIKLL